MIKRRNAKESGRMGSPIILEKSDILDIEVYKTGKVLINIGKPYATLQVKGSKLLYNQLRKLFNL